MKMRSILRIKYFFPNLLLFCLIFGSVFAQPKITSFTPTSGAIGTTVTITGTNFSTTAANIIVYFGAVRATVTSATSTSLSVTVPVGATYQPITVTANGLTAYSRAPFIVTFTGGGSITASSFASKVDFTTGSNPWSVAIGDVDGDGKPDLVVANYSSNTVSVFRNTSASGSITASSFASKVDFTTGTQPRNVAIGDVDGDGKPDLAVANEFGSTVSVFRNTSTSGSITASSFASKVDFTTGVTPFGVAIGDVDGDGKPDLAVANYRSNTVSVFRNTSTSGSITASSFASKVDFTTGAGPISVAIGDVDGDGKPDLAVANNGSSTVSVLRNTSTSGSITASSFASKVDFTTGTYPYVVTIGDVDGDGKPDLAVTNNFSNTVSVFRNTSASGSITASSFASKVDFTTGTGPISVAIGDVDGDGKPDLAVANNGSSTVSVLRNTSTSGSITASSFASKVDFTTGTYPYSVAIGDVDGDGKPDLAVTNWSSNTVSVLRNAIQSSSPSITSFTPSSGAVGTTVTIKGTNFSTTQGTSTIKFGTVTAIPTSWNDTTIVVTVPSGVSGAVTISVTVGGQTANSATQFTVITASAPTITSFTPVSGAVGTSVTITGTNFGATQGTSTVKFGTVTATPTSWSNTQIVTTVPNLTAGSYTISVTVSGQTVNSTSQFAVAASSDPIVGLYKRSMSSSITNTYIYRIIEEFGTTWAYGNSGLIAQSTDGFTSTWTMSNTGIPSSENIFALDFVSTTTGFAGTGSGKIYRTTNGGSSWALVYNNTSVTDFINYIKFFNSSTGIAVGDGLYSTSPIACLVTNDGGSSWSNYNTNIVGGSHPNGVRFPSASAGFLNGTSTISGTKYGGIFRTTNYGSTWLFYTVGNSSKDSVIGVSAVDFTSSSAGLVVKNDSTVWKTLNGGVTWTKIGGLPRIGYSISYVSGTSLAYIVGRNGLVAQVDYDNNTIASILLDDTKTFYQVYFSSISNGFIPDYNQTRSYFSTVTTSSPLSTPSLLSPGSGSTVNPQLATLRWSSVSGATVYDVEVGSYIGSVLKSQVYSVNVTSKDLSNVASGAVYQWRVRARSTTNSSAWSSLSNFVTSSQQSLSGVVSASFPSSPKSSTDYRLVTIPSASSISVSDILSGSPPKDFRIYRDNGGVPPNHLDELNGSSTVSYGEGFWLLKKNNFVLNTTLDFPSLNNGNVALSLRTGWNIIGNPFAVSVKWSDVLVASGLTSNAVAYSYQGQNGFIPASVLEPFVGYYYFSNSGSLSIPFPFSQTPDATVQEPVMKLNLVYSSSLNTDKAMFVGVDPSAREGFDDFESHKPPIFADQGSVWFDRSEWDGKHSRFTSDIRPALGDGQTWDFIVHHPSNEVARLTIEGIDQLPTGYNAVFINTQTGVMMKPDSKNGITVSPQQQSVPFSLIIGKQNYIKSKTESFVPQQFILHQNYPNPFNPSTTINYQLPTNSHVTIKVYDVLGKEVATLVDEVKEAGSYEVKFSAGVFASGRDASKLSRQNAGGLASGIYFYRLRAGNFVQTKKMLLTK